MSEQQKTEKTRVANHYIAVILCMLLWQACIPEAAELTDDGPYKARYREATISANKYMLVKDAEIVQSYAQRRNIPLTPEPTGLWYYIKNEGEGIKAQAGQTATITYELRLLDGTLCYAADNNAPKQFVIGKGQVEHGLDMAITKLAKGGSAKFILPPHLAYGLIGDQNKIQGRQTIVYDLVLVDLR